MNLDDTIRILTRLDRTVLDAMVAQLRNLKARNGRLFCIGNGGGAAHASHAAADFRKIGGIEAYAFDNLAELTASINDEGWDGSTARWLDACRFTDRDALLVFSVGGGSDTLSANLRWAYSHAKGATILGITGQPGRLADYATVQLVLDADTAQTESVQAVLAHYLVNAL